MMSWTRRHLIKVMGAAGAMAAVGPTDLLGVVLAAWSARAG